MQLEIDHEGALLDDRSISFLTIDELIIYSYERQVVRPVGFRLKT